MPYVFGFNVISLIIVAEFAYNYFFIYKPISISLKKSARPKKWTKNLGNAQMKCGVCNSKQRFFKQ